MQDRQSPRHSLDCRDPIDYGEGSADNPGFPKQPDWFSDNRDFKNIENGLVEVGFDRGEIEAIMGKNWYNFYNDNFVGLD